MSVRKVPKFNADSAVSIQSAVYKGENAVRVNVDFSRVPAPDAYYVADYARVEVIGTAVQMIFGKLESGGRRLRNKLEVNVPAYAFMGQWVGSIAFLDKIRETMVEKGFPPYSTPGDVDEYTDKVQTVHANNSLIAGADSECCVDLYFLPPRDLRFYFEKNAAPHLEPLVRIITEGRILASLGKQFRSIAEQVKQYAPAREEWDEVMEAGVIHEEA